jgi:hypothetical protein
MWHKAIQDIENERTKMKISKIFGAVFGVLASSIIFVGCDNKKENDNNHDNGICVLPGIADSKVYIDSVPSGAEVYLLPANEESKQKDELLGKTPLIIESSKCQSMRFLISMDMDYYIKQVEKIPEMQDWIKRFKSEQYFGDMMMSQEYFNFDTPNSRFAKQIHGGLVSTGPVYSLSWPNKNRLCALFIPRGKDISLFYPLMPPAGTFPKPTGGWHDVMIQEYHFSEEQYQKATNCMTRCGKYLTRVKDPYKKNTAREFSMTAQGGKSEITAISSYEVDVIPGYND